MYQRNEAITLLKEAKAIVGSAPGSKLPLTKPRLTEWSSYNDDWLVTVALYFITDDYNKGEAKPTVPGLISDLSNRLKMMYQIDDSELE